MNDYKPRKKLTKLPVNINTSLSEYEYNQISKEKQLQNPPENKKKTIYNANLHKSSNNIKKIPENFNDSNFSENPIRDFNNNIFNTEDKIEKQITENRSYSYNKHFLKYSNEDLNNYLVNKNVENKYDNKNNLSQENPFSPSKSYGKNYHQNLKSEEEFKKNNHIREDYLNYHHLETGGVYEDNFPNSRNKNPKIDNIQNKSSQLNL